MEGIPYLRKLGASRRLPTEAFLSKHIFLSHFFVAPVYRRGKGWNQFAHRVNCMSSYFHCPATEQ
jgi:hypothetical protein